VTGKDSPADRTATMALFAAGELDVLVATTVIEVGINVPNATVMVILGAHKFGLSQLHQLRGRVGRANLPGTCYLVATARTSAARERIEAMCSTTDGFELAERDLAIRGVGTLLGTDQSGVARDLRVADLVRDADLLTAAKADAVALVGSDPHMTGHGSLRAEVFRSVGDEGARWLASA
jgi:ATP-dependent DNA helicase RecG